MGRKDFDRRRLSRQEAPTDNLGITAYQTTSVEVGVVIEFLHSLANAFLFRR